MAAAPAGYECEAWQLQTFLQGPKTTRVWVTRGRQRALQGDLPGPGRDPDGSEQLAGSPEQRVLEGGGQATHARPRGPQPNPEPRPQRVHGGDDYKTFDGDVPPGCADTTSPPTAVTPTRSSAVSAPEARPQQQWGPVPGRAHPADREGRHHLPHPSAHRAERGHVSGRARPPAPW